MPIAIAPIANTLITFPASTVFRPAFGQKAGKPTTPDWPLLDLNGLTLRAGTRQDFPAVLQLMETVLRQTDPVSNQPLFPNGPVLLNYVRAKNVVDKELSMALPPAKGAFWVLTREKGPERGAVAGCAALIPASHTVHSLTSGNYSQLDTGEITKIYLHPDYWGRGIGHFLLNHLIDSARKHGYRHLFLAALTDYTAARALYRKAGFRELPVKRVHPGSDITVEMGMEL